MRVKLCNVKNVNTTELVRRILRFIWTCTRELSSNAVIVRQMLTEHLHLTQANTQVSVIFAYPRTAFIRSSSSTQLKNHNLTIHEGLRFSCDKCTSIFTSKTGWRHHIQTKHKGLKYECDLCDYRPAQKPTSHTVTQHKTKQIPTVTHVIIQQNRIKPWRSMF